MTKQVKAHDIEIVTFLDQKHPENIKAVLNQHLLWIGFLQHERLIHLIITLFFALIEIILFLLIVVAGITAWWLILLTLIIAIMLAFYVWHYYFLENTCQLWYAYADQLQKLE